MTESVRTVFLSSTAKDLSIFREAVHEALLRMDGIRCVRMEDFGARNAMADDFCREGIGGCDLAVFLVGLCFGSSLPGAERSYTGQEYEAAKVAEVPRLVFLTQEGHYYAGYYREADALWDNQQQFRARLSAERRRRDTFTEPEELAVATFAGREQLGQGASAGDAEGRSGLLEQAIFSRPALRDLAERPLLLTLMASLHAWRGGSLPEGRERLYADALDLLLNLWEERRLRRDARGHYLLLQPSLAEYLKLDRGKVRGVLEALAFDAHRSQPKLSGTADIAEDALVGKLLRAGGNPDARPGLLVEYLRERAGVLYSRGLGVYTFPHRSFQEYLAACHLTAVGFPEDVATLVRAEPNRWREVALLAAAKPTRGTSASLWQLVDEFCFREPGAATSEDLWEAQLAAQALLESADLAEVSAANLARKAQTGEGLAAPAHARRPVAGAGTGAGGRQPGPAGRSAP